MSNKKLKLKRELSGHDPEWSGRTTHWEGCWHVHRACAIAKTEAAIAEGKRMQRELKAIINTMEYLLKGNKSRAPLP